MPIPESEDQVQFLFKTQRLLSEGSFVATYAVDHFIPWSRYRLDLGHNYALAHTRCNVDKSDRLAAFDRLKRWHGRNRVPEWSVAVAANALPSDLDLTTRVAAWAYGQAEGASALVWSHGRDGMVRLDSRWRGLLIT